MDHTGNKVRDFLCAIHGKDRHTTMCYVVYYIFVLYLYILIMYCYRGSIAFMLFVVFVVSF